MASFGLRIYEKVFFWWGRQSVNGRQKKEEGGVGGRVGDQSGGDDSVYDGGRTDCFQTTYFANR